MAGVILEKRNASVLHNIYLSLTLMLLCLIELHMEVSSLYIEPTDRTNYTTYVHTCMCIFVQTDLSEVDV